MASEPCVPMFGGLCHCCLFVREALINEFAEPSLALHGLLSRDEDQQSIEARMRIEQL